MKEFIFIIIALMTTTTSFGKNKIECRIVDANNNSILESATIALLNNDSTFVCGGLTDSNGRISIKVEQSGNYILRISYIGYQTSYADIVNFTGDLDLGDLSIMPNSENLNEIVVEGSKVSNRIDRQIILPTDNQRKISSNGMSMLKNLHLARLNVNPIDNSLSTVGGDAVQLRINGKEVAKTEITALKPSEIVRIEYIDNPGLRYNSVGVVVNFIVNHRVNGGNVSADLTNGVSILGYGEYTLSAKYNTAKSEFSTNAYISQRNVFWTRENTETFRLYDKDVKNEEVGKATKVKYDDGYVSAAYTYLPKQGDLLSITISDRFNDTPNSISDRESSLKQEDKTYNVVDKSSSKSNSPSLDIYYQHSLAKNQKIYFDFIGTYTNSNMTRTFSMEGFDTKSRVFSAIDGDKYSAIAEAIYEKASIKGTFTAGFKHSQSYLKNNYSGDENYTISMNTAETYGFVEWKATLKGMFDYSIGIGAMNTYNSQGDFSQSKIVCRPTISLSQSFGKHWFVRYNGYVSAYAPSLAALNNVTQTIDAYQKRKGNPNLKTVTFLSNTLSLNFKSRHVQLEMFGRYSYDRKPIMESSYVEDNFVIRSNDNQKGFHRLNFMSNITILPWGEHVMLKVTPFVNRYVSLGNEYTHTHTNWGMRGNLMAMFGKWAFAAEMSTSEHVLWGETLTKGEKLHELKLGYNEKNWSLGIGVINPFSKYYDQTVENLSTIAPSHQYAYSTKISQILLVNMSINLDFGKWHHSYGKRINNKDIDNGILTGVK